VVSLDPPAADTPIVRPLVIPSLAGITMNESSNYWGASFSIAASVDVAEAYIDRIESFITSQEKRLEHIARQLRVNSTDIHKLNDDTLQYEEFMYGEVSRRLRCSLFLALYAFMERHIATICASRQPDAILLTLREVAGRSLTEKLPPYWTKVLGLEFPSNSYWGDIHKGYRLLRNCIAHNEGRVDDNLIPEARSGLQRFVRRRAYRHLVSIINDELVIRGGFCSKALDVIDQFLCSLLAAVPVRAG
jgi:hypothetical protein